MAIDWLLDRAIALVKALHDSADPQPTYDTTAAQAGLNKCRRDGCNADAMCGSCGQCAFHCGYCNG
jgi:hypothetical protein